MKCLDVWLKLVGIALLLNGCSAQPKLGLARGAPAPPAAQLNPAGPTQTALGGPAATAAALAMAAVAQTPAVGMEGQGLPTDEAATLVAPDATMTLSVPAITDAFKTAGLPVSNVAPAEPPPEVPRGFREHVVFEAPGLAPAGSGGQVFVCERAADCDAVYAYFAARTAGEGSYLYRNAAGTVVVQLNGGMQRADAAKFGAALQSLK